MNKIICQSSSNFFTASYGAFRWDKHLYAKKGQWALISSQMEFDRMRDVPSVHIDCVVDDFGNLVGVTA